MNPLETSIKKTLAYFSLFGRPLTDRELYSFLWQPPFLEYAIFLSSLKNLRGVENKNGFYFLSGDELSLEKFENNIWLNDHKMRLAQKAVNWLKCIPFVKAIFVCNSVSLLVAEEKSDIDLLIITARNRVWLVRFFTNLILRFLGKRVYGNVSKDKICLSFFADEDSLDFSGFRIKEDDINFAYWLQTLVPIFYENSFSFKLKEKNVWLKKFLPMSTNELLLSAWGVKNGKLSGGWRKFWESAWGGNYGDLLENQARGLQESMIKKNIKDSSLFDNKRVVYNKHVIKLHQNDDREEVYSKWQKKCV